MELSSEGLSKGGETLETPPNSSMPVPQESLPPEVLSQITPSEPDPGESLPAEVLCPIAPAEPDPRCRTSCWGCGSSILLPDSAIPEGQTADMVEFGCSGCKARNIPKRVFVDSKKWCRRPRRLLGAMERGSMRMLGLILMFAVPLIVVYIFVSGVWVLIPMLDADFPQSVSLSCMLVLSGGFWLTLQVLTNYALAVMTRPGSPDLHVEYGTLDAGRNGRLAGFSLCHKCCTPRPARAHHCSVCNVCVFDMDHHCPFINNCVGYRNRRSFVLFLIYAVLGCAYALGFFVIVMATNRAAVFAMFGEFFTQVTFRRRRRRARWSLVWKGVALLFFILSSFMVLMMVGVLLCDQVKSLFDDVTSLEGLTALERRRLTWKERWQNMRKTLGPLSGWLLPARGPFTSEQGGWPAPARVTPRLCRSAELIDSGTDVCRDDLKKSQ